MQVVSEPAMAGKNCDNIDKLVGANIRVLRLMQKMSQAALAQRIGVTFQQLQKYERGINRIGAGRLLRIANVFRISVNRLFAGADDQAHDPVAPSPAALLTDPAAVRLVEAFCRMKNNKLRRSLVTLTEVMATHGAVTKAGPPAQPRDRRRPITMASDHIDPTS